MEIEKIAEVMRNIILGEIKDEFREFRASVTGELSGFRLAIESINARQANIEHELRDIRRSIDETNKRIDETNKKIDQVRDYLIARIDETNKRIDALYIEVSETKDSLSSRIDALYIEVSAMRGELKKALSDKEIIHDMIFRIQRLESKAAA